MRPAGAKYDAELEHWQAELPRLVGWYQGAVQDWWGLPAPIEPERQVVSDDPAVNALHTAHALRPGYRHQLLLDRSALRGQRVLEVGCGPLGQLLQFTDCVRHGLDPLLHRYLEAGWPLAAYGVAYACACGEAMPYPDGVFDAVVAVNALDHVDDFGRVAAEIERVLRAGGRLFFEIEYHQPTLCEPQRLDDATVVAAFPRCRMVKVAERGKQEVFLLLGSRHREVSDGGRLAVWHGQRLPDPGRAAP